VFAQTPNKMSYQAVIRNSSDALVADTQVGMQISILEGSASGTVIYVETQTPTTNANGLVVIEIGGGTVVSGDFATIDWANGSYFIKTETDPDGGINYSITGTSQLLSVPYALHANEIDPSVPQGTQLGQMQYWNGTEWVLVPTGTEGSTLEIISGIPAWSGGEASTLPGTPIIGTAIEGDGQASVAYTEPASSTTSPILSYTATSDPGNFTGRLIREGSGTIIVTGLTNGTAYTFTVTATNENGTSDASAASNSVTPSATTVSTVTNPVTGRTWMDRNLGAEDIATSSDDQSSWGDLYQWGRGPDGHESRRSDTTSTLSDSDAPGHGDFILSEYDPGDWRSTSNDDLWQGVNGANNPCPSGFRLPTQEEWYNERGTWSSEDSDGAFASVLKLPEGGRRDNLQGLIFGGTTSGNYWSSTIADTGTSYAFYFNPNLFAWDTGLRGLARSVRCIKDEN
jgi:uncharacterized protein (TIGR02145 family)